MKKDPKSLPKIHMKCLEVLVVSVGSDWHTSKPMVCYCHIPENHLRNKCSLTHRHVAAKIKFTYLVFFMVMVTATTEREKWQDWNERKHIYDGYVDLRDTREIHSPSSNMQMLKQFPLMFKCLLLSSPSNYSTLLLTTQNEFSAPDLVPECHSHILVLSL